MKKIIVILLPFIFLNCSPTGKIIISENEKILIGKATKLDLENAPFDAWYVSGFNEYQPNEEVIGQLKDRGITLIAMDKNKTTIENYEAGLNINKVPTFIFYKKGVEINRIFELPKVSLEQDMLDILSSQDYNYEN